MLVAFRYPLALLEEELRLKKSVVMRNKLPKFTLEHFTLLWARNHLAVSIRYCSRFPEKAVSVNMPVRKELASIVLQAKTLAVPW